MYPPPPLKLVDCTHHGIGSGAELYVVEGDSAAGAIERLRNIDYQAVLPLQGKPLNTLRASAKKVAANPWFAALIDALGTEYGDAFRLESMRYDRVVLLMDPDADGIHCGALAMMFFYRWMRPLVEAARLGIVLAPVATVTFGPPDHPEHRVQHVHSEPELRALIERAKARPDLPAAVKRYRGLGGTDLAVLDTTCVQLGSRMVRRVTPADVETAITMFSAQR